MMQMPRCTQRTFFMALLPITTFIILALNRWGRGRVKSRNTMISKKRMQASIGNMISSMDALQIRMLCTCSGLGYDLMILIIQSMCQFIIIGFQCEGNEPIQQILSTSHSQQSSCHERCLILPTLHRFQKIQQLAQQGGSARVHSLQQTNSADSPTRWTQHNHQPQPKQPPPATTAKQQYQQERVMENQQVKHSKLVKIQLLQLSGLTIRTGNKHRLWVADLSCQLMHCLRNQIYLVHLIYMLTFFLTSNNPSSHFVFSRPAEIQYFLLVLLLQELFIKIKNSSMACKHFFIMVALISVCSSFFIQAQSPINGYDRVLSAKYASYAAVAFCPKNCVESWSCGTTAKYPKLVNVTYIENSVTKAVSYIGYDPSTQTMVTSWRGSDNTQNWIEDFNFEMEAYLRCSGCFIHVGFMSDFKLNQKRLSAAAEAIVKFYKVSKILCTGHSLGAALSLINGIQFAHKFSNIPVEVHNFGSPRIGNQKLASHLREKISAIYRVVHNKDIVPHLPPEGEYKHPATEIFFDKEMANYKVCSESGEDKTCSNQFFPNYDPNDHDLYFVYISQTKCC